MKKETNPGIIAAAVIGLVIVIGLIAYKSFSGPSNNVSAETQAQAKHMKEDPISQGKEK